MLAVKSTRPVSVRVAFGRFVRVARGSLTQTQLADRMGVAQNTVSAWEKGKGFESESFDLLLQVLGIDLHQALKQMAEFAKAARPSAAESSAVQEALGVEGSAQDAVAAALAKPPVSRRRSKKN